MQLKQNFTIYKKEKTPTPSTKHDMGVVLGLFTDAFSIILRLVGPVNWK
jgi:hypothetical protein